MESRYGVGRENPVSKGHRHTLRQGQCLASLAATHGLTERKIWMAPENQALRNRIEDGYVLLPGDRIFIPDIELAEESVFTDQRHKFRVKRQLVHLRIQFLEEGEPCANQPYLLQVGGQAISGSTNSNGELDEVIPAHETMAQLRFGEPDVSQDYTLGLGALDPIDSISGVQARLQNLGYDPGPIDGLNGPRTKGAVSEFQEEVGLTVDGIVGPKTRRVLKKLHRC